MRLWVSASSVPLAACTLLFPLDDQRALPERLGTEGGVVGPDASRVDADNRPDAAFSCGGRTALLCVDFDDAGFTQTPETNGTGALSVETTNARSAPRSLAFFLPGVAPNVTPVPPSARGWVMVPVAGDHPVVRIAFDVRVETPARVTGDNDVNLVTLRYGQRYFYVFRSDVGLTVGESVFPDAGRVNVNHPSIPRPLVLDRWTHLELAVNLQSKTSSFSIDGDVVEANYRLQPDWTTGALVVTLGTEFTPRAVGDLRVRWDNFLLTE